MHLLRLLFSWQPCFDQGALLKGILRVLSESEEGQRVDERETTAPKTNRAAVSESLIKNEC